MADFPLLKTGAIAQYPVERTAHRRTVVLTYVDGGQQSYRDDAGTQREWRIQLRLLDEDETAALERFFLEQKGTYGRFSFTDPWDGTVYPDCSFADDTALFHYESPLRSKASLTVKQNRS